MMNFNLLRHFTCVTSWRRQATSITLKNSITDTAFSSLLLAMETQAVRTSMSHRSTLVAADAKCAHDQLALQGQYQVVPQRLVRQVARLH